MKPKLHFVLYCIAGLEVSCSNAFLFVLSPTCVHFGFCVLTLTFSYKAYLFFFFVKDTTLFFCYRKMLYMTPPDVTYLSCCIDMIAQEVWHILQMWKKSAAINKLSAYLLCLGSCPPAKAQCTLKICRPILDDDYIFNALKNIGVNSDICFVWFYRKPPYQLYFL